MDTEQKPEPKNKIKKSRMIGRGPTGYEHGIYYNLKHCSNFDVLVSMRIQGKPVQRSKENIKSSDLAIKIRNKFVKELENLKEESMRGDMLWSKAVGQYFKHLESLLKIDEISYSTYDNRVNSLTYNTKSWGNKRLSEIHTEFIREFLFNNITADSNETKRSILKYISQVFRYQILRGNQFLKFNPASGIKFKKTAKEPAKTMSVEEVIKLVNYAKEIKSEWEPVYYLAFQLGCRSGELYALKWSDINWEQKNITVRTSYCWRREEEKSTKSFKSRTLPLNQFVIEYLTELKEAPLTDETYILPRIKAWKSGRAAAILAKTQGDLKITKTNFHGIRSAFITNLLTVNVAPIHVMEMAGHEDFKTTMVYVRELENRLKGTTDLIGFKPKITPNSTATDVIGFPVKIPKKDIAS